MRLRWAFVVAVALNCAMAMAQVGPVRIVVTPSDANLPFFTPQQYTAKKVFFGALKYPAAQVDVTNQVVWSSSNQNAVTIDPSGMAVSQFYGGAIISATSGPFVGSTGANVGLQSIDVVNYYGAIPKGLPVQFYAYGNYIFGFQQDITNQATWSSGTPNLVVVGNPPSNPGVVTGTTVGQNASVFASAGGISGGTTVDVTPPAITDLKITPLSTNLACCPATLQQFTATAIFSDGSRQDVTNDTANIFWGSFDNTLVDITAAGSASGLHHGSTSIYAEYPGCGFYCFATADVTVVTTAQSITITPANPSVEVGDTLQLLATASNSDLTTSDVTNQAQWISQQ